MKKPDLLEDRAFYVLTMKELCVIIYSLILYKFYKGEKHEKVFC